MIWILLGISAIFVLYHMPARLFLRAGADEGFWISLRVLPFAERVVYLSVFPEDPQREQPDGRAILAAFLRLWRRGNARIAAQIRISTGDAAKTAILCGGIQALGRVSERIKISAMPLYAIDAQIRVRSMFRAKTGHILLAGIAYLREKRRKKNGSEAD